MTESILQSHSVVIEPSSDRLKTWIRRLVWKLAIATLMLMAVGSATRVMNAGLACPDWPLCYGQWIPREQMNLQVFLEWFHRLDAALIGLSTLALVIVSWLGRNLLPPWLPKASLGALGLILVQGLLGGLTVTQLLRFDIVTAHLGTALLFLASLLAIGLGLSPYNPHHTAGSLRWLGGITAILIYSQCLLGGLVGSRWAAHQCLNGGLAHLCGVMSNHLWGVLPVTLGVVLTAWGTWRTAALHPFLRQLALSALGLVVLQMGLGLATLYFHLQIEPLTVAHHTVGACLWGILFVFTFTALRDHVSPSVPVLH